MSAPVFAGLPEAHRIEAVSMMSTDRDPFVRSLVNGWLTAPPVHRATLVSAFATIFETYACLRAGVSHGA